MITALRNLRRIGTNFLLFTLAITGVANCAFSQRVYLANGSANNLSAYSVAPAGTLAAVPGSPFATGTSPAAVASDPAGRFVYVANSGSNDVSAYTIDADTGSLTPVAGSPFAAGLSPSAIIADATGKFVYVADSGSNDVSAFLIDSVTGALTSVPGSPFVSGAGPSGIAVNSTGKFAYVTNSGSGSISAYAIDSTTGALNSLSGSPYDAGKDADSVTLDPSGRFIYVTSLDVSERGIRAFAIDSASGELSPVAGSPFAVSGGAVSVKVHPSGKFLYVAGGDRISAYAIDSQTGALALLAGSRIESGFGSAIAMDAAGAFVFGADSPDGISAYAVDANTGALTPARGFSRLRSNAIVGKVTALAAVNRGPLDAGGPLITAFTPGNPRNNFTGGFGLQFTLGPAPLTVTALGRIYIAGNTQTHVVKLVNASDGSDVPGGSVTVSLPSGTPGQFVYVPLASPVTLAANATYYLITLETAGGDFFYDAGPVTPASVATINSSEVFFPGVGYIAVGTANLGSGLVNLLYGTATVPPNVSIITPVAGPVSGNSVTVSATATASTGLTITSVQFQVDNVNQGLPVTTPPYSIILDTTKLTNGTHTITAIATDSANNSTVSAPVVVMVGNTATTVTVIAPPAGSTISGNNVTLTATATPGSGLTITSVQFKVDNVNLGLPVTTSPYTTVLDATKLTNGPHMIVAVATDSANITTISAPVNVTVNNTVTTVAVTSPVAGSTVSGTNVALAATATPGTGLTILNVQFKVDNVNQGPPVTASPYGVLLDTTTLTNGTHTVVAVATDSANIMTPSAPVIFMVNNGGAPPPSGTPLITAFSPGPQRNNFTGGFGMQFTVGSAPLSVTALGRIYITGNTQPHVVKLVRASNGSDVPGGSVTVSLPSGAPGQFAYVSLASPVTLDANATYYLISLETNGGDQFYDSGPVTPTNAVTVNSAVVFAPGLGYIPVGGQNLSSGPVNLLYVAPGTPPAVTITTPAAGAMVSGSVTVSATATAGAGLTIASVQFKVDNVNVGAPVAGAPYSIALDTTKLSNGSHSLTAVATDSANNTNISAAINITVNNSATTVAITSPTAGSTVSGTNVPVTVAVSPGTGLTILNVQYKLDNVNLGAPVTTSPFSTVLDSTKLTNGPHSLVAVVTDSSNTVTPSAPVSFTVNNTATTVAITSPAQGATVSGNSVPVTATATPGTGLTILNVQFKVDGNNLGAPVTTSPYGVVLDTTTLTDGTHTLIAVATDSSNATVMSAPVMINVLNGGPPPTGTPLISAFTPGNLRNDATGGYGMRFTVGTSSINVTALGRIYIAGNGGSHVVKLVNVSDGTDVPGGSVTVTLPSGVPGQFAYVALASPVTLGANITYDLISQETAGGDMFFNLGPVTATGAASVNSGIVYSPMFGILPVGPANYSFVPVNLLYTTGP